MAAATSPPNFAFPNFTPGKHRIPPDFKLWPEPSSSMPATPPIPPTVATGDVITAVHENTVTTALSDLWTNEQWLASQIVDAVPTSRQVIAGAGMSGGGALSADVTLNALVTSVFGRTGAVTLTSSDITGAGGVPATRTLSAGAGLTGGGDLSADRSFSVVDDTTTQRVRVLSSGSLVGTRPAMNFIQGSNVTLSVLDDAANNRVNLTIASTGGGGSGGASGIPIIVNGAPIGNASGAGVALWSGTINPNGVGADKAPHNMTSDTSGGYVVTYASSQQPGYQAFNGLTGAGDAWISFNTPCWLQIDLGAGRGTSIASYAIRTRNDVGAAYDQRQPKTWNLQGSNDGSTWTTVDSQSNQPGVANGGLMSYSITPTAVFRYWQINITLNQGSVGNTEIGELYLYAPASPFASGSDGDIYIDTLGKYMYGPKTGTAWPPVGKLL